MLITPYNHSFVKWPRRELLSSIGKSHCIDEIFVAFERGNKRSIIWIINKDSIVRCNEKLRAVGFEGDVVDSDSAAEIDALRLQLI
jgi:hypothetical protein